jgi:hypothetical protein
MHTSYASVHRAARKLRAEACQRCGTTAGLQMALDPRTPRYQRRYDPAAKLWFSVSPLDYMTLCVSWHSRMDRQVRHAASRIRRAKRTAPRCTVCRQPMMCGQRGGTHLGCASGTPQYGPLASTESAERALAG